MLLHNFVHIMERTSVVGVMDACKEKYQDVGHSWASGHAALCHKKSITNMDMI
jgi:hypothetical protein